jgi:hypothetical protein
MHCGSCPNACPPGFVCTNGMCRCPPGAQQIGNCCCPQGPGFGCCNGACTSLVSTTNCGACGNICFYQGANGAGWGTCSGSTLQCRCPANWVATRQNARGDDLGCCPANAPIASGNRCCPVNAPIANGNRCCGAVTALGRCCPAGLTVPIGNMCCPPGSTMVTAACN